MFKNNSGYQQGGAVFTASGVRLQISGSEFTGNSVETEDKYGKGGGGGLFFESLNSLLEIQDTSFSGNSAPKGYVNTTTGHDSKFKNILSVTAPFSHVLNNFDINYTGGSLAQLVAVTFVAQDDAGTTLTQQVISGKAAIQPSETFVKENHTFTGWYTDAEATAKWDFSTPITGTKTLYGGWLLNEYTVNFDLNGAPGAEIMPQTVLENTLLAQPAAPEWEGRVFQGWFTEEGLLWIFAENQVTKSQTLYARWQRQYVVAFETNGGNAVESQTVAEGTLAGKPAAPAKEGYTFAGWYKNAGLTSLWNFDTDKVNENITLYAAWQEIPVTPVIASYRIMYDVNWGGHGTTQIEDQTGYLAGQTATLRGTVPVRSGYTFAGWNTGANGGAPATAPAAALPLAAPMCGCMHSGGQMVPLLQRQAALPPLKHRFPPAALLLKQRAAHLPALQQAAAQMGWP
ncbi:MAG: InlB B-repeat-containing protein [Oscillospiraceae bacterium]